jgi:predicted Zn-ribbon and HTH transcriptional regulator
MTADRGSNRFTDTDGAELTQVVHVTHKRGLLNISNLASFNWPVKKKNSAVSGTGKIVDITFPAVPPGADESDLIKIGEALIQQAADADPNRESDIYLFGDLGLTCFLVPRLQEEGWHVVHSTVEQLSVLKQDGTKRSVFRFVRFRPYVRIREPLPLEARIKGNTLAEENSEEFIAEVEKHQQFIYDFAEKSRFELRGVKCNACGVEFMGIFLDSRCPHCTAKESLRHSEIEPELNPESE